MAVPTIPADKVKTLTERLEGDLRRRLARSREILEEAVQVMPNGVPSSFQEQAPHPIYLVRGAGSRVWDVDGNEYVDYHNGFGVMVTGHAHPAIVEAVTAAAADGSHFAMPTEGSVRVATELVRRFRLPQVRFTNSGTESTLDAVHLARAATGKDVIVKIEGTYHGHHDALMVSVVPDPTMIGPRDAPHRVPYTAGVPKAVLDLTLVVPFNDLDAMAALLGSRDDIAGVFVEPLMLNIGVVPPAPGYLAGLRELTARHGVVLVFDEVKTGATIAAGGAVEHYGVVPDVVCLAKAIGGGVPTGAVLATEELMSLVADGTVKQYGTFNGNPLSMAAAEAALTRVLDDDAYRRLAEAGGRLMAGCQAVCDRYGLPAYVEGVSTRGCVMFASERVTDYRSWATESRWDLQYLAWLYHMHAGHLMYPGETEQWTLSVAHTDAQLDDYVAVFEQFAADIVSR